MIPDQLLTALSAMAKSFGKHFTGLKESVDALPQKLNNGKAIERQTQVLTRYAEKIDRAVAALSNPNFNVSVATDDLAGELRQIAKDVRAFQSPNLSNIEVSLKALYTCMEKHGHEQTNAIQQGMKEVATVLAALRGKTQDTFKLDDMQFRTLSVRGGGGTNPGILAARRVSITNLSMTSANTQYSHTFSANTVAWRIRVREVGDIPVLVAFASGKLPTSGDGSAYFTVPAYYVEQNSGMDWGGKTIYVQTASASQVLEIVEHRAD